MASRIDYSYNRKLYVGTSAEINVADDNAIIQGRLGIGSTSAASASLDVYGETGDDRVARFESPDDGAYIQIRDNDTLGQLTVKDGIMAMGLGGVYPGTTMLNINTSGNVGIGIANAGAKLHNFTQDVADVWISGYGTLAQNDWRAGHAIFVAQDNGLLISKANANNNTNRLFSLYHDSQGNSEFYMYDTTSTNKVYLNSSGDSYLNGGNVGIGLTGPAAKLDIKTATAPFTALKITNYGSNVNALYAGAIDDTYLYFGSGFYYNSSKFRAPSTTAAITSYDSGTFRVFTNSGLTADTDYDPTERMRVNSNGTIKFNAYGAGTLVTDASGNITVSSGGGAGGPYLPVANPTFTGTLTGPTATFTGGDVIINSTATGSPVLNLQQDGTQRASVKFLEGTNSTTDRSRLELKTTATDFRINTLKSGSQTDQFKIDLNGQTYIGLSGTKTTIGSDRAPTMALSVWDLQDSSSYSGIQINRSPAQNNFPFGCLNVVGGTFNMVAKASTTIKFMQGQSSATNMEISGSGDIKFNNYGAGTLVTDADGNITASSSGPGTGTVTGTGTDDRLTMWNAAGTGIEDTSISLTSSGTARLYTINGGATGSGINILRLNKNAGGSGDPSLVFRLGTTQNDIVSDVNSDTGELRFRLPNAAGTESSILELKADGDVAFPEYGAGTLVTDASGNITASSGGGAGGPYLPVANPTFTGVLTGPSADLEFIKLTAANPGILMKETDTTDKNWDIQLNSGNLKFYEVNDARSVFDERVTFEAGGNVGIGSTNPAFKLDVGGNGRFSGFVEMATGGAVYQGQKFYLDGGGDTFLESPSSNIMTFTTNAVEKMRISSNGNVTIGNTASVQPLTVAGAVLFRTTTVDGFENRFQFLGGGSGDAGNFYVYNDAETPTIRLNAGGDSYLNGGNVGIGTTTPGSRRLNIFTNVSTNDVGMETTIARVTGVNYGHIIKSKGSNATQNIGLFAEAENAATGVDGNNLAIWANKGAVHLCTANTTDFVGIGMSAPTLKLEVVGNIGLKSDSAFLRFRNASAADLGYITNSTTWGDSGSDFSIGASSANLRFYTNNSSTERMRILANGNVGIGTISPTGKLTVSDAGGTGLEIYPQDSSTRVVLSSYDRIDNAYRELNYDAYNHSWEIQDSAKMVLINNGNVGIGITNPGNKLEVTGIIEATVGDTGGFAYGANPPTKQGLMISVSNTGGDAFSGAGRLENTSTANSSSAVLVLRQVNSAAFSTITQYRQGSGTQGSLVGFVRVTTTNTIFSTSSSDERLKKNITNWTEDTLGKFKALQPKKFRYKIQDASEEKTSGFIAQNEVANFPEAYVLNKENEEDEAMYSFNPMGMTTHLMKAIKDLVEKVEILENKITQLEN